VDNDYGDNGVISYSIMSGNVGNAFSIDPELGILQVARELNIRVQPEYMLMLKATDHGALPLSATVPVHILLTMADTAPPRFLEPDYATEVYENLPKGHFVIHVEARSQSSLFYEIIDGNHGSAFQVNPSTGIIMTRQTLDFEAIRVYNLTVQASNMVGVKSTVSVNIHILDVNDNPPRFLQNYFEGTVSENSQIGSLVLVNQTTPLVLEATDADSGSNSLLMFQILEDLARNYFTVDSSTGAVRTIQNLDYETQKSFEFDVKVSDMGKPRLSAETIAHVKISLRDENDCPPVFDQQFYNVDLLLPTFKNVSVYTAHATDPDTGVHTRLQYSIVSGNMDAIFGIDKYTGRIFVKKPDMVENNPRYSLDLEVSDGRFTGKSTINLTVKKSENSGLAFGKSKYYTTVLENSTKSDVILVVNVLGSALNENLEFKILNPTDMFRIGETSGALATTGIPFDREEQENYELVLQVTSKGRARQIPRYDIIISFLSYFIFLLNV
jgi:protocadherin Fat 1/2/3